LTVVVGAAGSDCPTAPRERPGGVATGGVSRRPHAES
jgi:hypothetical protein